MLESWIFIILLNMPSFGGPVEVRVRAATEEGCQSLRRMAANMAGGEKNINGSITKCDREKNAKE